MENEKLTNLINTEGVDVKDIEDMVRPLTMKENIAAYIIAGTFVVGAVTIGYGIFKGTANLTKKIMLEMQAKKAEKEHQEEIDEIEEQEVQE